MDVRQPAVVENQEPGRLRIRSQAVDQESASQPVVVKQESDCGLKPPCQPVATFYPFPPVSRILVFFNFSQSFGQEYPESFFG